MYSKIFAQYRIRTNERKILNANDGTSTHIPKKTFPKATKSQMGLAFLCDAMVATCHIITHTCMRLHEINYIQKFIKYTNSDVCKCELDRMKMSSPNTQKQNGKNE